MKIRKTYKCSKCAGTPAQHRIDQATIITVKGVFSQHSFRYSYE